jgi:hypothetical protein
MLNHSSFQKRCVGQRNGRQSQKLKMNSVSDSGEHQSLEVLFLRSAVAAAALLLLFWSVDADLTKPHRVQLIIISIEDHGGSKTASEEPWESSPTFHTSSVAAGTLMIDDWNPGQRIGRPTWPTWPTWPEDSLPSLLIDHPLLNRQLGNKYNSRLQQWLGGIELMWVDEVVLDLQLL